MKIPTLVIACFYLSFSLAQQYSITKYTLEDGLIQSNVYSLHQDARGYLWIGTITGQLIYFITFLRKVYFCLLKH